MLPGPVRPGHRLGCRPRSGLRPARAAAPRRIVAACQRPADGTLMGKPARLVPDRSDRPGRPITLSGTVAPGRSVRSTVPPSTRSRSRLVPRHRQHRGREPSSSRAWAASPSRSRCAGARRRQRHPARQGAGHGGGGEAGGLRGGGPLRRPTHDVRKPRRGSSGCGLALTFEREPDVPHPTQPGRRESSWCFPKAAIRRPSASTGLRRQPNLVP